MTNQDIGNLTTFALAAGAVLLVGMMAGDNEKVKATAIATQLPDKAAEASDATLGYLWRRSRQSENVEDRRSWDWAAPYAAQLYNPNYFYYR